MDRGEKLKRIDYVSIEKVIRKKEKHDGVCSLTKPYWVDPSLEKARLPAFRANQRVALLYAGHTMHRAGPSPD
ncbi:hypothetical protein Syun_001730 [Stephania yunnanensis]|uniref:Uncharacterized protein n=1 Tax=Stephania yunnanensis TaxID=152371 RepID=A0AAP0LH88_9MAGN